MEPPQTDEGWFVFHDFRTIDWDAWRAADPSTREGALEAGRAYLDAHESVTDADEGVSAAFAVPGDDADILLFHCRPTLDHLSVAERRLDRSPLGAFLDQTASYVSVTEVSGYVSDEYFAEDGDVEEGLKRYIEGKLEPDVPDDTYVSFYPMAKRRGEQHNWYALSFEERAELMAGHGDVGREFAGRVTQVISSSVGLDNFEWGVTLFADDPTDLKDLVYAMRFDEATAHYGEFGAFTTGRRFAPGDLEALFAGDPVPSGGIDVPDADYLTDQAAGGDADSADAHPHGSGDGASGHGDGGPPPGAHGGADRESAGDSAGADDGSSDGGDEPDSIRGELADLGIYAGSPDGDVHAVVAYAEADEAEFVDAVESLTANFDHYDTHEGTSVYQATDDDRLACVSLWATPSAAETAAGFISDLPGRLARDEEPEGFGTMGMFYTVKADHREDFLDRFEEVGALLDDMDGHESTSLFVDVDDVNDMFIASQWRSREDALEFFRSEAFRDTVEWGREVLADRPRHVFLA
jgi:chlorite dismutase/heme-degrading monooxygenase HmoA